nr:MAG TPA: hypothetical protein [Caudoviricetes sp.]
MSDPHFLNDLPFLVYFCDKKSERKLNKKSPQSVYLSRFAGFIFWCA